MFHALDTMLFAVKFQLLAMWEDFQKEEKGAAEMVSIILVIAIVVALAIVFRKQIKDLIDSVFKNIDDSGVLDSKIGE